MQALSAIVFTAGDTFVQTVSVQEFPPATYDSRMVIVGLGEDGEIEGVEVEGQHAFNVSATDTGAWAPGSYRYVIQFISKDTEAVTTYGQGTINIAPNPLLPLPVSWVRSTLTQVEAALTKLAGKTNSVASVNGQSFTKVDLSKLVQWRKDLKAELDQENALAGKPSATAGRTIITQFVNRR